MWNWDSHGDMGFGRQRVQSVWLASFVSLAGAVGVALAACGGKGVLGPAPGAAGSSGESAAGNAGLIQVAGAAGSGGSEPAETHAENGALLPSIDSAPESCGALGIGTRPCSEGPCLPFVCPCAPDLTFNQSCEGGRCIDNISCPGVCKSLDPMGAALECTRAGVCRDRADCSGGAFCLHSHGEALGHCSHGEVGESCFRAADCKNGACVAGEYIKRTCSAGQVGDACNLDRHCAAPARCMLAPQYYLGKCGDGSEGSPCVAQADCESPAACVTYRNGTQLCSRGELGSPCDDRAHCASGLCALGQCSSGEVGSRCEGPPGCKQPYCVDFTCTTGGNGARCKSPTDCAIGNCIQRGELSECSDGKQGSACSNAPGTFCQIGLHCAVQPSDNSLVCVGPAATGEPCGGGGNCASGSCAYYKGGANSVCTTGKLGEHCAPGQCVSGLFCASTGLDGICVSGAPGDPCTEDASCQSATCGPAVMLDAAAQSQCATATGTAPCGNGGACVFKSCHPRSCL